MDIRSHRRFSPRQQYGLLRCFVITGENAESCELRFSLHFSDSHYTTINLVGIKDRILDLSKLGRLLVGYSERYVHHSLQFCDR